MKVKFKYCFPSCFLLFVTIILGFVLSDHFTYAIDYDYEPERIDDVLIGVPVSCNLTGTNVEHTATVNNGTYQSNIGLSTIKAYCNDTEGFSIYAVGYTNEEEGNTVLTNATLGSTYDINTGTSISGNNSQWAMKLATNSGATYPLTLGSDTNGSYSNYHVVPSTYTKVAYRNSGTDIGQSATGATMTSTYQVYISPTQVAGAYAGKVKYLLIHPVSINSVSTNALTANFVIPSGSNMLFEGGATTNTVKYRQVCTNPSDSTTCSFITTEGKYQQPTNYKGVWIIPMPGMGTYSLEILSGEDLEYDLQYGYGADLLGYTLTIIAYDGDAIFYDGNGATAGDMSMVTTRFHELEYLSDNIDGLDIDRFNYIGFQESPPTFIAPNFKKDGYGFAGWSTNSNATPGGSSTIYGPNETIDESDFSFDSHASATLYAVWVQSAGTMQGWTCPNNTSMPVGTVTALTDNRDGNTYAIAKLADGNCWMIENLRLDDSATLNSSNTNNPAIFKLSPSSNEWCNESTEACIDQSFINTNNTNINGTNSDGEVLRPYYYISPIFETRSQWYGYGNYYNWYSATAGTGTYSLTSGNATGDICPAGWSLPTGGTNGEFKELDIYLGGTGSSQYTEEASNRWRSYPNNFLLSGYWDIFAAGNYQSDAFYWTRSTYSSEESSGMVLFKDGVIPPVNGDSSQRHIGLSLRCLAK